jgi:hypothetical protein
MLCRRRHSPKRNQPWSQRFELRVSYSLTIRIVRWRSLPMFLMLRNHFPADQEGESYCKTQLAEKFGVPVAIRSGP